MMMRGVYAYLYSQGRCACCYSIKGVLNLDKLATGTESREGEGVLQSYQT